MKKTRFRINKTAICCTNDRCNSFAVNLKEYKVNFFIRITKRIKVCKSNN